MCELIVIEGIDGSGKGTQASRLLENLRASGRRCELFSFPRYRDTRFGAMIGQFLNGRFGQLNEVSPFLVSLLFAGDRLESKDLLQRALSQNDIVVCDRYVASNIAHQAAKLDGAERRELIDWIQYVEYSLYGLPVSHRTIFLDLPVATATHLITMKSKRSYTDRSADLQEADTNYLQRVHDVYVELTAIERNWLRVDCLEHGELKSIDRISSEVWSLVTGSTLKSP